MLGMKMKSYTLGDHFHSFMTLESCIKILLCGPSNDIKGTLSQSCCLSLNFSYRLKIKSSSTNFLACFARKSSMKTFSFYPGFRVPAHTAQNLPITSGKCFLDSFSDKVVTLTYIITKHIVHIHLRPHVFLFYEAFYLYFLCKYRYRKSYFVSILILTSMRS